MRRILVTGASGFVGGSFLRSFQDRDGVEICGLGRRKTEFRNYVRADLGRSLELDWRPDIVIHAAARSSPWGRLSEFRRQNVLATQHIVDFCEKKRVDRLIYISSSSVFYRDGDQFDITEDSPIGPSFVNHYARTKYEAEGIALSFSGETAILRPRAVFGPHDTVLFPRILNAAKAGRMVSISRPGPPCIGDLIYIDSLTSYILQAATEDSLSGAFNLTNGEPVEIQRFIAEIFAKLGLPPIEKSIPRQRAMFIAGLFEKVFGCCVPWLEPPITRFGVGVLSYSKTFDVSKSVATFGPPSVGLAEGVDRFVKWQTQQQF